MPWSEKCIFGPEVQNPSKPQNFHNHVTLDNPETKIGFFLVTSTMLGINLRHELVKVARVNEDSAIRWGKRQSLGRNAESSCAAVALPSKLFLEMRFMPFSIKNRDICGLGFYFAQVYNYLHLRRRKEFFR